ncbi:hypothetical protein EZV62_003053 [Acer yangbiense]|uniref:HIT-type domain-containing protein n=1 Tax=Acer yangbiense TaxID=1000413 RepID=A0A5C7IZX9_9ROSI|nr:hypothetical protein EZV62_003053 [Acer yangbiense]
MEEERRMSTRTRKVAPKMAAALASTDNRTQVRQLLLGLKLWKTIMPELNTLRFMMTMTMLLLMMMMMVFLFSPIFFSAFKFYDNCHVLIVYIQKKQLKGTKRKTRQAKALEDARKAPRTFLELLHEASLESLPPHVPTYLRAAVGPPSSTSRRHFCTVCGFTGGYMCVKCGMRFCSIRCQHIHDDTRCMKFVA